MHRFKFKGCAHRGSSYLEAGSKLGILGTFVSEGLRQKSSKYNLKKQKSMTWVLENTS